MSKRQNDECTKLVKNKRILGKIKKKPIKIMGRGRQKDQWKVGKLMEIMNKRQTVR